MFVILGRLSLVWALLTLTGCVYYEDDYYRDHERYERDNQDGRYCYDTEYGRRCRHGGGENDQGEDEQ